MAMGNACVQKWKLGVSVGLPVFSFRPRLLNQMHVGDAVVLRITVGQDCMLFVFDKWCLRNALAA